MNVMINGVVYVPEAPKVETTTRIHDLFARCRRRAGMTLQEVSDKAKVSMTVVAKAEMKGVRVSVETAVKLADVYGISLELIAQAVRGMRK